MFFGLGLLAILFVCFVYRAFRKPEDRAVLKEQIEKTARLLKSTDKSLAEIALEVGEKKVSRLERNFRKVYRLSPLEYRRKND
jgi:transcriptional regulator GlxA family with amidase domain